MKPLRTIGKSLPWMCTGLAILGVAVRLTVKDSIPLAAPLYYATPPQLIAALALVASASWFRQGRRRPGVVLALAGLGGIAWSVHASRFDQAAQGVACDARIVVWNISSGRLGWAGVDEEIRGLDADVVGLVEAGSDSDRPLGAWEREFPDYSFSDLDRGLLLMARGPLSDVKRGRLGSRARYLRATVRLGRADVDVILIDVSSNPRKSRKEPLEAVAKLVEASSRRPVFMMGDYNTPIDSVHFEPLRSRMVNAFEQSGDGYAPTWPVPLPVIQIDHIWSDGRVPLIRCEAGWSWSSDHRPVWVDVALGDARS